MAARDPLAPDKKAQRSGAAGIQRGTNASWELGKVLVYHAGTHCADVRTMGVGGRPLTNVPQIKPSSGSYDLLEAGATVVISWDLGFTPVIVGVLDIVGTSTAATASSITGVPDVGIDDPLQPVDSLHNYRPSDAPPDLMSGDYARVGDRGQSIAVLKGGVAQLGSPTAQIRSLGLSGLLQFIGQKMQGISDFGEWNVVNDGGKTSFILRAGYDQTTQTGMDEEHWTIRLDLGATGDVFNFEITTPEGQTLFRFHVGPDGYFQIFGAGGGDISTGPGAAGALHDIAGDQDTNVQGSVTETVDGDVTRSSGQAVTESVGTDKKSVIGNNDLRSVNNDDTLSVGGVSSTVVTGGGALAAKPGRAAKSVSILNGGYIIDIGDPTKGSNLSAKAGFELTTFLGGDIKMTSGGGMTLKAKTTAQLDGTVVNLGSGTGALPLWPTFRADLGDFLQNLLKDLLVGTAGSPVKQLLTSVVTDAPTFAEFIAKLKTPVYDSKKVNNE